MDNIIIIICFTVVAVAICFISIIDNSDNLNEHFGESAIDRDDIKYFNHFMGVNLSKLIDNNKLSEPRKTKNTFLFITFDDRDKEYIKIHNNNIKQYAKAWGYDYKFITKCDYNVYWCKIQLVLNELTNGNYDYVVWLDSDTAIKKQNIDINDIVNKYSSDIFVGSDNIRHFDFINAGVFIIKNTQTGKQFLQDCINNVNPECFNENGTLKGIWAASCYEQGQMNLNISTKYRANTTVLSNDILLNFGKCFDDTFIMHLYGNNDYNRTNCLSRLSPDYY